IFFHIKTSKNVGVHMGWNMALSLVNSKYFVCMDNDIYVPDLEPCWLTKMVDLMNKYQDMGAIACMPHTILGGLSKIDENNDLIQVGHCGAVARIMDTEAVRKAGGWERHFDSKRNHEEKTVCSRLASIGKKSAYAKDIIC